MQKTIIWLAAGIIAIAACSAFPDNAQNPEGATASPLAVPLLTDRIMDQADILNDNEEIVLRTKILQLETDTTAQMAILTIPDLQNEILEDYSLRVANTWKLGRKDRNNGILILVAINNRVLRIEVGLGLETVLTHEVCKGIIVNEITPFFKKAEYYQGLDKGVAALSALLHSSPGQ